MSVGGENFIERKVSAVSGDYVRTQHYAPDSITSLHLRINAALASAGLLPTLQLGQLTTAFVTH